MISDDQVRRFDPVCGAIVSRYYAPGLDRDDLIQEARIGVVQALRGFRGDGGRTLNSFVAMVAERKVVDAVKAAGRAKHEPLNGAVTATYDQDGEWVDALDTVPAPATDPHERVVNLDEARDLLRHIADDLTPLERDAIIRHTIHGEPYANRGRKDKRADNAVQRARRKARRVETRTTGPPHGHVRPRPAVPLRPATSLPPLRPRRVAVVVPRMRPRRLTHPTPTPKAREAAMKPRRTHLSNCVFALPGGNEDNDLWVLRGVDDDGEPCIGSVWEPTDEERQAIANGENVALVVWGEGTPPVKLTTTDVPLGARPHAAHTP